MALKLLVLGFVKAYQKLISPLFPATCRYYPTCSNYAVQAIEMHGAFKGSAMSIARIIRCNPFVSGGVDKVPDHFMLHRNPDTINHIYLGDGMTIDPNDEIVESDELNRTIARVEPKMVIKDEPLDAVAELKEIVDISERSIEVLPDAYMAMNQRELLSRRFYSSEETLLEQRDFHFYHIIKNSKSEAYFAHVHPSPIHKDYQSGCAVCCFLDQNTGYIETNSPLLEETFKKARGISQKDLKERNALLLDYLLFLESTPHDSH